MAFGRLTVLTALAACGGPTSGETVAPQKASRVSTALEYPSGDAAWGKFHSKRYQLTIPLPDGRGWKIDDHHAPELVATHEPTSSRLTVLATREPDLMNRARCEARARTLGLVPASALTTVEDDVHVGPDAYDARVWVAVDPGRPDGRIEGHVFLFGAFLRQCLLVHLSTAVPSSRDEGVLASRLAIAGARMVKGIAIDPPRTTDDAVVPRDKPNIRR